MPARPGSCSVYVTRREAEVLSLLAQGFGNEEIGVTLELRTGTVKQHISSASFKLLPGNSDKINCRILLARNWGDPMFRIGAGGD